MNLRKIENIAKIILEDTHTLVSFVVGMVLLCMGFVMLTDHVGLLGEQVKFFDNIGIVFFIGGLTVLILCGIAMNIAQQKEKEN